MGAWRRGGRAGGVGGSLLGRRASLRSSVMLEGALLEACGAGSGDCLCVAPAGGGDARLRGGLRLRWLRVVALAVPVAGVTAVRWCRRGVASPLGGGAVAAVCEALTEPVVLVGWMPPSRTPFFFFSVRFGGGAPLRAAAQVSSRLWTSRARRSTRLARPPLPCGCWTCRGRRWSPATGVPSRYVAALHRRQRLGLCRGGGEWGGARSA